MRLIAGLIAFGIAACVQDSMRPDEPQLAIGVTVGQTIKIDFPHAMQAGMEKYALLHRGDINGPVVPGTWTWARDMKSLVFTPASPLAPKSQYTIQLGGTMHAQSGHMAGVNHGAMTQQHMNGMMGPGWQHAPGRNGMLFAFTTP